jgi:hypothetical protein
MWRCVFGCAMCVLCTNDFPLSCVIHHTGGFSFPYSHKQDTQNLDLIHIVIYTSLVLIVMKLVRIKLTVLLFLSRLRNSLWLNRILDH